MQILFQQSDGIPQYPMEEDVQDNWVDSWSDGIPEVPKEEDSLEDLIQKWRNGFPQHPMEEPSQDHLQQTSDLTPQPPARDGSEATLKNEGTPQSLLQEGSEATLKNERTPQYPPQEGSEASLKNGPRSEDLPEETVRDSSTSFVLIKQFPDNLTQNGRVEVEYYCADNSVVVVDLTIMLVDSDSYFTVFSKAWTCLGQGVDGKPKTKLLKLRLPDTLVYRPDYFLKADSVWQVSWCKIRAWLIDESTWFKDQSDDIYASSKSRDMHKVNVPPPFSRPYRNPACTIWIWPYVQKLHTLSDSGTCPVEQETVTLLNYPAVFSGNHYGILRELTPYNDWRLEKDRAQKRPFPQ
ncbi:hypothetical protein BsWGS_16835 [Bradybaena similaris]